MYQKKKKKKRVINTALSPFDEQFSCSLRSKSENHTQIDILICDYCGNNLKTCHWL